MKLRNTNDQNKALIWKAGWIGDRVPVVNLNRTEVVRQNRTEVVNEIGLCTSNAGAFLLSSQQPDNHP